MKSKNFNKENTGHSIANRFDFLVSPGSLFIISTVLVIWFMISLNFHYLLETTNLDSIIRYLDTYVFPPNFDNQLQSDIIFALIETIQMALIATYFGAMMAIPMALMAARNIMPWYVSTVSRTILAGIRSIPSLIWAVIFIIFFGLGARTGTIALTFYTVGYLGKFAYEAFENLSSEAFEALGALGANKLQLIRYVVFPESSNLLISQIIFMFEYNIRASSIIGLVGAGGIGLLISIKIEFLQYDAVFTAILYILIVVLIIDYFGGKLRQRYQDPTFQDINV